MSIIYGFQTAFSITIPAAQMDIEKTITEGTPLIRKEETRWIWNDNQMQMIEKTITFVPFLYQLFDQILVSAADDRKGVKDILVNINVADNNISVWTHGGEVVDDIKNSSIIREAQPLVSVSVMSGDGKEVLPAEEVFNRIGGELKKVNIRENWCLVSLKPHLAHFGMECLEHDIVALMKRRVVDLAGCSSGLNVRLAGTCILPRLFEEYVELYLKASFSYPTRIYEKLNDRWEICVATADEYAFEHFEEVIFVNNVPLIEGGFITSRITSYLATIINLEPNVLENYLWVFVNAHIHDPPEVEKYIEEDCELTPEYLDKIADSLKDLESLQEYFEHDISRRGYIYGHNYDW